MSSTARGYRLQALDTEAESPVWRDIVYFWDSFVGWCWTFESEGRRGLVQDGPWDDGIELINFLLKGNEEGDRMRIVEPNTERVMWDTGGEREKRFHPSPR